jgi:hypothetical protein
VFIAYVVVSSLLSLALLFSGFTKVSGQQAMVNQLAGLGVARRLVPVLGGLLIAGAAGLIVGNWVGYLGVAAAGCLALYFLGAVGTHLRAGDAKGSVPPVVLTAVSATALVLRLLSL